MSSISKLIAMALAILLSGCISLVERRDKSFNILGDQPLTGTLMIIGGNSECSADKGLWAIREDIASRIAASLGIERKALSTIYFAWTGEEPGKGSCLPGFDYLDGEDKIYNQIAQKGLLSSKKLIVVGYSNGGATAADLSRLIKKDTADHRKVDLLITLDPVSRLTGGYRPSDAETWLNVYTRSKNFWDRVFNSSNEIAGWGGAWNQFDGPILQKCIQGNHHDSANMWDAAILSAQFEEWSAKNRIGNVSMQPARIPQSQVSCPATD